MSHLISREELKKIVNDLNAKTNYWGHDEGERTAIYFQNQYNEFMKIFNSATYIKTDVFKKIKDVLFEAAQNRRFYVWWEKGDYGKGPNFVRKHDWNAIIRDLPNYIPPESGLILSSTFNTIKDYYNKIMNCHCYGNCHCHCHSNCKSSSSCSDNK